MGTKTQKLSNVVDQIVEWQSVFTGDGSTGLTAVAGRGYFIDTTSGTVTVTLPASPKIGDIVQLKDYARTWGTNNVTLASNLFDGDTISNTFSTEGQTVTLVYMDGTKGWSLINEDTTTGLGAEFISATGGTVTTSGDYKIHTFTGDGCFVVSCAGNAGGSTQIEYVVVAGGGGGGSPQGSGGGGAGGFRFASPSLAPLCYPAKPLAGSTLTASAQTYPITVGSGGSGAACQPCKGTPGNNSVFSTITSAGGGGAGAGTPGQNAGLDGGSGGGGGGRFYPGEAPNFGGSGNTPPVSPPQGNPGGNARPTAAPPSNDRGGGGGGAISAGTAGAGDPGNAGPGGTGAGLPSAFGSNGEPCGSFRYYAGGGGGGLDLGTGSAGSGGLGGGGTGSSGPGPAVAGTTNTGGGGGGSGNSPGQAAAGGKGIVIIRYKFQ